MIFIKKKINSVQEWLPIREFYSDGLLKLKNGKLVKILKIVPINYDLKSEFEKKTILNSYKAFLKNCNFEIQIIIQSNKEDISENKEKLSSSKNFYILINSTKSPENQEENIKQELKEKYFKIKDSLSRCGNIVYEINEQEEIKKIISSFLNTKT